MKLKFTWKAVEGENLHKIETDSNLSKRTDGSIIWILFQFTEEIMRWNMDHFITIRHFISETRLPE